MSVDDYLEAKGHKLVDGCCELCWRNAATMYAMGQGPYESHVDAYHKAMAEAEKEALEHPMVKKAVSMFDAKIEEIKPTK